jgi:uncharacterized protein YhbP (UPF0306 family)
LSAETEVRERLLKFLREHQVLMLAVMEADGSPSAAALFYAVDDELRFHVVTDPATRHGKAMLANPSVAGTVQLDHQQWHEIRGVQFRGICRQLGSAERARAWDGFIVVLLVNFSSHLPSVPVSHRMKSCSSL